MANILPSPPLFGLTSGRLIVATGAASVGNANFTVSGNTLDISAAGQLVIGGNASSVNVTTPFLYVGGTLDTGSAIVLNIGTTNATSVHVNKGLYVVANAGIDTATAGSLFLGITGGNATSAQIQNVKITSNTISLATSGIMTLGDSLSTSINIGSSVGWVKFASAGAGVPTYTTRSAGTRLVLLDGVTVSSLDNALGVDSSSNLWISTHGNELDFYLGDSLTKNFYFHYLNGLYVKAGMNIDVISAGTLGLGPTASTISIGDNAIANTSIINLTGTTYINAVSPIVYMHQAPATVGSPLINSSALTLRMGYYSGSPQTYDAAIVGVIDSITPTAHLSFRFGGVEKYRINQIGNIGFAGGAILSALQQSAIGATSFTIQSWPTDGANSVGTVIDTAVALANTTSRVLSIRNNGTELAGFLPISTGYQIVSGGSSNNVLLEMRASDSRWLTAATGAPNGILLNYNVAGIEFMVGGSDQLVITSNTVRPGVNNTQSLGTSSQLWANTYSTIFTQVNNNILTANTIGVTLQNNTLATGGSNQYSPALEFIAQTWTGAVSQSTQWNAQLRGVTGNTNSNLVFRRTYNGAGAADIAAIGDVGSGLGAFYFGPLTSNDYIFGGNNTLTMRVNGTSRFAIASALTTGTYIDANGRLFVPSGVAANSTASVSIGAAPGSIPLVIAGSSTGNIQFMDSGGAPSQIQATSLGNGTLSLTFQASNTPGFIFTGDATAGVANHIVQVKGFASATSSVFRVQTGATPGVGALAMDILDSANATKFSIDPSGNVNYAANSTIGLVAQAATNTTALTVAPDVADGASSIALIVNAKTSLTTSGARIVEWRNGNVAKAALDLNGFFLYKGATSSVPSDVSTRWTAPTLLNSWVNFGGIYATVAYYKDANGIVHIRGHIKSGTNGTTVFVLPAGFRPSAVVSWATYASNGTVWGTASVAVDSSGNVSHSMLSVSGTAAETDINGSFPADA